MSTSKAQKLLNQAGFGPLMVDGIKGKMTKEAIVRFQRAHGLVPDGIAGPRTVARLEMVVKARGGPAKVIKKHPAFHKGKFPPKSAFPPSKMDRIIVHWTGGGPSATGLDKDHYHFLVEQDLDIIVGDKPVTANQYPIRGDYAAHTYKCNTGSIGVSMAGMLGAQESPLRYGEYPITKEQFDKAAELIAHLCKTYNIPNDDKHVLTHAEVQPNLGIKQRGKWDFTVLKFAPKIKGAKACGDHLRELVGAYL